MKSRNFPAKRAFRRARAQARAAGACPPEPPPHVRDVRFRIGAAAYFVAIARLVTK